MSIYIVDKKDHNQNYNIFNSFVFFQKIVRQSSPAATASYNLITSVLLCSIIGWYIDSLNGSSPIGILIGLFIGLIIGFYHLAKTIWGIK